MSAQSIIYFNSIAKKIDIFLVSLHENLFFMALYRIYYTESNTLINHLPTINIFYINSYIFTRKLFLCKQKSESFLFSQRKQLSIYKNVRLKYNLQLVESTKNVVPKT